MLTRWQHLSDSSVSAQPGSIAQEVRHAGSAEQRPKHELQKHLDRAASNIPNLNQLVT